MIIVVHIEWYTYLRIEHNGENNPSDVSCSAGELYSVLLLFDVMAPQGAFLAGPTAEEGAVLSKTLLM